jgi:hypothetical protein
MFVVQAGKYLFFFDVVLFGQRRKNGMSVQEFRPMGKLHSIADTPAVINYDKLRMEWYKDGKLHRDNGPACITFNEKGTVVDRKYYKNGKVAAAADIRGNDDGVSLVKIKVIEDCVKECARSLKLDEEYVSKVVLANTNKL